MAETKSPKKLLLEQIASEGYNVGYSASLHFATFDIACKVPTIVTVASFAAGIFGLIYPSLSDKLPSAILLVIGICMLYVRDYERRLGDYERTAISLNRLYKQLHDLIVRVQGISDRDTDALDAARASFLSIRTEASNLNVSPQIFGASWKAHHRLFWVIDSSWVRDHVYPRISWRDMAPLSFFLVAAAASLVLLGALLYIGTHQWCS